LISLLARRRISSFKATAKFGMVVAPLIKLVNFHYASASHGLPPLARMGLLR
jgi:hypothetical protein